jgi:hypothetical protein
MHFVTHSKAVPQLSAALLSKTVALALVQSVSVQWSNFGYMTLEEKPTLNTQRASITRITFGS